MHPIFPPAESETVGEGEYLAAFVQRLAGPILFVAANEYGLSARGKGAGEQLTNTRAHEDEFRVHDLGDGAVKIESLSSPGLCIGVGGRHGRWYPTEGFKAVLVSDSDPSCRLRLAPARNHSQVYISFEPEQHPGHLLNHCDGLMWFFNRPANNEAIFSADSSWMLQRRETADDRAMRLQPVRREASEGSLGTCPVCMESWETRTQVVTPCDHVFCMACLVSICNMTPPSTAGTCAMCRTAFTLAGVKRVVRSE